MGLLVSLAVVAATGIDFQLNRSQSSFNATLCILDECQTDSSSLSGMIRAAIECPDDARAISFESFSTQVDENLVWNLDYGFLGKINVNANGLKMSQTGDPTPFFDVMATAFEVPDVPIELDGVIAFKASGPICAILQGMGRLCEDTVDLGEQGPTVTTLAGRIEVDATMIRLAADFDQEVPLDPNQPELGSLRIVGQMRAEAPRPEASVAQSLKGKCKNGTLKAKLALADDRYSGSEAVIDLNGERFSSTIKGKKAKFKVKDRVGDQLVRLVDPPSCLFPSVFNCD